MSRPPQRRRGGPRLPFNRLATISFVLAASVPVGLMGLLIYDQVGKAIDADAGDRTARAVAAARTAVDRSSQDLDALVRSYADWDAFASAVGSGDLTSVRAQVLDFLVEQGTVSGGVVTTEHGTAMSGDTAMVTALLAEAGQGRPSPRVITVEGDLYVIDDDTIRGSSPTATSVGNIVLARSLDARFAAEIANLTGFAVGLTWQDGVVELETSPIIEAIAAANAPHATVVRRGDITGARLDIVEGWPDGEIILASRVSALGVLGGALPLLVILVVASTALIAMLLALLLARILRARLGTIHEGLTAVADGRVPPSMGRVPDDDLARLAAGLDRLVHTLDRREATVRRCLAAASAVPINLAPAEAAAQLATAATGIFGLAWCRLVDGEGSVIGASAGAPKPGDQGGPRAVDAPMGLGADGRHLAAGLVPDATWTDADQADLEVMGLLAGSVLNEAEVYGQAAGRADRLDRTNRLQREFLRSVSHNLRAPLATIELAAADLEEMFGEGFARERAQAILIEERRLARMVNQVLILSRIETGTLQLDGEPVALAPLAARVARELGAEDIVAISDEAEGAVAFTDPMATEQIVWILVDNARKYAPGSPIHIEVVPGPATSETGTTIVLAVEDEGPGVPPDDRRRIFQRFVRGTGRDGSDGTGLGLSVARGLARSLGGDVVYRPGRIGARFEVRLPSDGGGAAGPVSRP